eukprot:GILJ01014978.1.p1 GENE.GILJ01014978.1~~GILJ01014978.1.p1  ORF type:complete len:330 (-),score=45.78 GILJ01014978.1:212-1201(-)
MYLRRLSSSVSLTSRAQLWTYGKRALATQRFQTPFSDKESADTFNKELDLAEDYPTDFSNEPQGFQAPFSDPESAEAFNRSLDLGEDMPTDVSGSAVAEFQPSFGEFEKPDVSESVIMPPRASKPDKSKEFIPPFGEVEAAREFVRAIDRASDIFYGGPEPTPLTGKTASFQTARARSVQNDSGYSITRDYMSTLEGFRESESVRSDSPDEITRDYMQTLMGTTQDLSATGNTISSVEEGADSSKMTPMQWVRTEREVVRQQFSNPRSLQRIMDSYPPQMDIDWPTLRSVSEIEETVGFQNIGEEFGYSDMSLLRSSEEGNKGTRAAKP